MQSGLVGTGDFWAPLQREKKVDIIYTCNVIRIRLEVKNEYLHRANIMWYYD